ncbi:MAG: preprotein translocase subunit SecG [Chitinophagaceae bacterium]|jgi:preprotein translocase subunit SecG|nr:preprotein translocase subunit SecG [Chitinophagaceae bacterium]
MAFLLFILIVVTCAALAFFVLIQNPKGGGLAGSFGGLGNQMMGAKQSTDVVEKGTWVCASALLILTLGSFILSPKSSTNVNEKTRSEKVNKGVPAAQAPAAAPQQAPAQAQPQPANAAPATQAPAPAPAPQK